METVSAAEPQLNAIVKQYIEYMNYAVTLETFNEELSTMGKPVLNLVVSVQNDENGFEESLLSCFETGNFQHFFKLWESNIPVKAQKEDLECQKLEFNLHLYFAVFSIINNTGKQETDKRMKYFKTYLETKGSSLSQTTDFLPYYALPFVPNPMEHPSFSPLFTESWRNDVKEQLQKILSKYLKAEEKPELFNLFKSRPEVIEKERQQYKDHIKILKLQLNEAESKLLRYFQRFSQIQGDYHKLIGIAAELVDSLEDTIRGKMISSEYIQDLCTRLFNSPTQQSIDASKPGTTSNLLRASIAKSSQSLDFEMSHLPLDFEKIKNDLMTRPERKKGFLLQALRWRLTRSIAEEHRNSTMRAYVGNDLLGCAFPGSYQDTLIEFLKSSSAVVCQYFARLLNTMASLSAGRSYLSQSVKLVEALQNTLMNDGSSTDSLTSENILGCLQKLSLRRHLQSVMIENDLITWLIDVLEEHDSLSDYNLEYSIALLMNLCLRTSGKKKCANDAGHILKVLSDLLGHENQEIRPYVNGSLYSILALPNVREEARAMGMQEILECFLKDEDVDMQRQVQFIIKQLNLGSEESPINYDAQSDDDEDDLDEEGDAIDEELDKQEVLEPTSAELCGEDLLIKEYSLTPTDPNGLRKSRKNFLLSSLDQPLSRPITPRALDNNKLGDNFPRPTTTVLDRIPESNSPPVSARSDRSKSHSRPTSAKKTSQTKDEKQRRNGAANPEARLLQTNKMTKSDIFATRNKLRRSNDVNNASPRPESSSIPPLTRSVSPPPPKSASSRPGSATKRR